MNPLSQKNYGMQRGQMLDVKLVSVFVEVGTPEGRLVELESCIRPQDGLG